MILLTEVFKINEYASTEKKEYSLREVYVNPAHVFMLRDDDKMSEHREKGQLPSDLDERQKFTKVYFNALNHSAISIVGDVISVKNKLGGL